MFGLLFAAGIGGPSPWLLVFFSTVFGVALTTLAAGAGLLSSGIGLYNQFTDDDDTPTRSPASDRRRQLIDSILQKYNAVEGRSPTESSAFKARIAQARERNEEQRDRDASAAAARGLTGSQFEVAQDEQRTEALANAERSALVGAERQQNREQQQRLGTLMSGLTQQDQNYWRRRELDERRRQTILNSLGSALQSGAYAYGVSQSGGSSGGN